MSALGDDSRERQTRIGRMIDEFRDAQVRRLSKRHTVATLLQWVGKESSASAPPPQRPQRIFAVEPTGPRTPDPYLALDTYLDSRYASAVVLTFEQVEALLGFALPAAASTDSDWWTDVILTERRPAGRIGASRTANPNLASRTVTFERPRDETSS